MSRNWCELTLPLALIFVGGLFAAQQQPVQPDNTRTNQRDRERENPTADQAGQGASDREIMSKIRRSIVDDKSLSQYAKNVKIVAQKGKVTLRGPVHSQEEKEVIESKAAAVAGKENVVSALTVKPETHK
jgi:hyperosmotically inducible protein